MNPRQILQVIRHIVDAAAPYAKLAEAESFETPMDLTPDEQDCLELLGNIQDELVKANINEN